MSTQEQQTSEQGKQTTHPTYPGHPRSLQEDWEDFSSRVQTQSSEGAKLREEQANQKQGQVDLTKATPKEIEEWNKTGEVSREKQDQKPEKEKATLDSEGDARQAAEKIQDRQQPLTPVERFLERASKEPEFEEMVERYNAPIFPNSAEGNARSHVLAYAMEQISNREDVIYFLARPENGSVLRNMQNAPPEKIAEAIHSISADLRWGPLRTSKREERPKPRAPKPPAEIGGRGSSSGNDEENAVRNNDFASAERIWNERLRLQRR